MMGMNILIITTFYPPDTAIAAVRPYMFAKYLSQMGHHVTVLRSGMIDCTTDSSLVREDPNIRIISYMGENSASERFERGEEVKTQFSNTTKEAATPNVLRNSINKALSAAKTMMVGMKVLRAKKRFVMQKACIDRLAGEHFDAVFATYSQLENVYAGKYAAEKFGCKWILDLRDPIARRSDGDYITYLRWKAIQRKAVSSADTCISVSVGGAKKISEATGKRIITLYNGYDDDTVLKCETPDDGVLRFAYTGVMYQNHSDATFLFEVLRQLADAGEIDLEKVQFEYAGPHFDMIQEQAKQFRVEHILVNHRFVSRTEAAKIQARCDIFVVLTWNTKYEQGVLTGKFYEGIRARKPILTLVTGDVPNCELSMLNQQYHYGFCYEACSKDTQGLKKWVLDAYQRKSCGGAPVYAPDESLFEAFTYKKLTSNLVSIMEEMAE